MNSQNTTLQQQTLNRNSEHEAKILELLQQLPSDAQMDVLKIVEALVRVQLSR